MPHVYFGYRALTSLAGNCSTRGQRLLVVPPAILIIATLFVESALCKAVKDAGAMLKSLGDTPY